MAGQVELQQLPPAGKNAKRVTTEALEVRVSIDMEDIYNRLLRELMRLFTDLGQRGISGPDLGIKINEGLSALSDTPIEQSARKATAEANNLGRNLSIQSNLDTVTHVVRSAILDERTCDPCEDLDGAVREVNSQEFFDDMPPNKCDGWEMCRCFYIPKVRAA